MNFSNLVAACERAWARIQQENPDVPDAVIVVGSGGRRAQTLKGHFAKDTWDSDGKPLHEVLIVAEQLKSGAEDVFNTLIHESVHGLAHTRKIKDVSGKRHNKKFAYLCEEVGLIPPDDPHSTLGYSDAQMDEYLTDLYADEIAAIAEELKLYRKLNLVEKKTKKTTWIAECGCERKVRLPKKTIISPDILEILCCLCDQPFELTEADKDEFEEMFENA